ncbi:MAG: hypothetical protein ABI461_23335 [Polyangiaceae bacterium]
MSARNVIRRSSSVGGAVKVVTLLVTALLLACSGDGEIADGAGEQPPTAVPRRWDIG